MNIKQIYTLILVVLSSITSCSAEDRQNSVTVQVSKAMPSLSDTIKKLEIIELPLISKCFGQRSSTEISYLMLHFCSNANLNPQNPYRVEDIKHIFETYGVSAHYLIDREGTVYRLVNEKFAAYHAGKGCLPNNPNDCNSLNSKSIGIEMMAIGTEKEMEKFFSKNHYQKIKKQDIGFTDAQYEALAILIEDILARNPSIKKDRKHIIGHDEYAPERRSDPGSLFEWSKIGL
ncbi:MAG: N-acetylmuramoyl-L-alanine amidase [Bernardetiaceae bacterium]|nr:N-acetylmuramoyl-L-alanine amidase [Bernardetiaceae bacterium]